MSAPTDAARARYTTLIEATLRAAVDARLRATPPDGLSMELALPAIARLLGMIDDADARLVAALARLDAASLDAPVVDGAGQSRSVYRPLLVRALARAAPPGEQPVAFARYADPTLATLREFGASTDPVLAADGATVAARAFEALAVAEIRWRRGHQFASRSPGVFERLVAAQNTDGTFLTRTSADQLEPAWYHELAVLHAVRQYADRRADGTARDAVARSAHYHAAEVQPDHASSHPFGLAALLDHAEGIYLADMMLHAAGVQQPATMDAVSLVLLYDALGLVE